METYFKGAERGEELSYAAEVGSTFGPVGGSCLFLVEIFLARLALGAAVSEVLEASASEVPDPERFREAAGTG